MRDNGDIRLLDNPFTGKKIVSTFESRHKAKIHNALHLVNRAVIHGGPLYIDEAYNACLHCGIRFPRSAINEIKKNQSPLYAGI
jgi:hypothetical protein